MEHVEMHMEVRLVLNRQIIKDVMMEHLPHTYTMVTVGIGTVMVVTVDQVYHVVQQKRQLQ